MWVEKILRPGVKCVHIVFISILSGHWVGRSPPSNPPHTSESEEPWVVSALLYWFNIYSTLYILHLMLQTKFPGDPRQEGVTVERRTFKQQGKTSTRVLASLICPFLRPVSGRLVHAGCRWWRAASKRLHPPSQEIREDHICIFRVWLGGRDNTAATSGYTGERHGCGIFSTLVFTFCLKALTEGVKSCTIYLLKAHTGAFTIQYFRI